MRTEELMKYLKDIVDLETQRRIAKNTYEKLSVIERQNAYVNHASIDKMENIPGIMKRIKWIPFIGKLYLSLFVAALIALLLKWILIIVCYCIGVDVAAKSLEAVAMIISLGAVWGWIIKKEIQVAQNKINSEKTSRVQYVENVKKGRIILAQIQKDKPDLERVYTQCSDSLRKLYGLNIVHPEYQYLEACGMFLQYLNTGRTHSLEQNGGDAGAYNLYENDVKFNIIKKQLDQVQKNQQILYGALMEINSNVEELCSSVEKMGKYAQQTAKNTKISAWCNSVTAINTYALRRMQEEYVYYR